MVFNLLLKIYVAFCRIRCINGLKWNTWNWRVEPG